MLTFGAKILKILNLYFKMATEFQNGLKNENRNYYKKFNDQKRSFNQRVSVCRALHSTLLTSKTNMLPRWKERFDVLMNPTGEVGHDTSFLVDKGITVAELT